MIPGYYNSEGIWKLSDPTSAWKRSEPLSTDDKECIRISRLTPEELVAEGRKIRGKG